MPKIENAPKISRELHRILVTSLKMALVMGDEMGDLPVVRKALQGLTADTTLAALGLTSPALLRKWFDYVPLWDGHNVLLDPNSPQASKLVTVGDVVPYMQ